MSATAVAHVRPPGRFRRWVSRHSAPYLLGMTATGWLVAFFLIPLISGLIVSLETGNPDSGYTLTWNWSVYKDLFVGSDVSYITFLLRSLFYGATATALTIASPSPAPPFARLRPASSITTMPAACHCAVARTASDTGVLAGR